MKHARASIDIRVRRLAIRRQRRAEGPSARAIRSMVDQVLAQLSRRLGTTHAARISCGSASDSVCRAVSSRLHLAGTNSKNQERTHHKARGEKFGSHHM